MKGKITIGQYDNYRDSDDLSVHIQVEDEISGSHFLEIHMTPRDFAQAVLGKGYMNCEFELHAQNVGEIRQIKTESIYMSHSERKNPHSVLAPYEVDGWSGRVTDLGNQHKATMYNETGAWYEVSFIRFVSKE